MKTIAAISAFVIATGLAGWTAQGQSPQPRLDAEHKVVTLEQFDRWITELSNWGRWGKDDQLGAVNLITPAKRMQAMHLAKEGVTVSLAHDLITEKASDAQNPYVLKMTVFGAGKPTSMDAIEINYHGETFTHLDALCHVPYKGKLYNGLDFQQTVTDAGCSKMGITALKDGLVTRGILLDIPRLKGLPYLEPATHVYREDIEAWEKQAHVRIGPGDAILLRTGRWARRAKLGPAPGSGYDASVIPFLRERDVALVGADTANDVGMGVQGLALAPLHRFVISALGANLFDNLDLEALAETAARLHRWEFTFVAAPVRVPNGTGGPINPIAIY